MQVLDLMSTNDSGSKFFGIDQGVVDVREHLELVGHADVVAVRRQPERDDPLADLTVLERLDHAVLARHLADPGIGSDGHGIVGLCSVAGGQSSAGRWSVVRQRSSVDRQASASKDRQQQREQQAERRSTSRAGNRASRCRDGKRGRRAGARTARRTSSAHRWPRRSVPRTTAACPCAFNRRADPAVSRRAPYRGRSSPARTPPCPVRPTRGSRCSRLRRRTPCAAFRLRPSPGRSRPSARATS